MEKYKKLFNTALAAAENAYAPYSGFKVGAAVMTADGNIYTGVNVENASYGATICAERVAVSAAVTAGHTDLIAVAVGSPGGVAYPCGICRQVIFEFGENIDIITGNDAENLEVNMIKELLPKGFKL